MCSNKLFSVFITLMTVNDFGYKAKAFRSIYEIGYESILALEKEKVNMDCRKDMPMRYCGFIHPSGKRYSFTGQTTSEGKCSIKIHPTLKDAGTWRCHIGGQTAGVETMKTIQLRVVGPLAAVYPNITAMHGKSYTLHCIATKGFIPLSYCRFEPPNSRPFSIDSSVTETRPLLQRYYFPNNKSLDRGDCAVTIRKVSYDDHGTWTCGAGFDDGNEYTDVIDLKVEGFYSVSAKVITFLVIGLIALLVMIGFFTWKHQALLGSFRRRDQTVESHELEQLPTAPTFSRPGTPQPARSIPIVTIESPSVSSEPGTRTPLVHESAATR